ncbi:MAG: pyridoxal phosphate-dependent aminotransferase [Phycisphaerales bacterium]|nr:pyridoxal phosphate-dependent aminotransferase [Phycisphaerales bacterium]
MANPVIADRVRSDMQAASWVREMFERGRRLKARLGEKNVHDFSLGNPNAAPPAAFFDALRAVAAESTPQNHRYMNNAGFDESRAAVAALLSREIRAPIDAAGVLLTCGAAGAMNVVLRAILNPQDEVVVFAPYFPEYRFYIEQAGGRMVVAESTPEFQVDARALRAAVTPRTRAVIVNSPNNPTGVVYTSEALAALAELLREVDQPGRPLYLICDDIYRRLVFDQPWCPAPAPLYHRSIITSSYSKDLSVPGERIGYVALPPPLPERELLFSAMTMLNRTLGFVNAPALQQRIIARCADALGDVGFYRSNRDLLCGALREMGYELTTPGGAFYAFPRSPITDDVKFIGILEEHNILAVPGVGFGRPGHVRFSFCVARETIERALDGLAAALRAARAGAAPTSARR